MDASWKTFFSLHPAGGELHFWVQGHVLLCQANISCLILLKLGGNVLQGVLNPTSQNGPRSLRRTPPATACDIAGTLFS